MGFSANLLMPTCGGVRPMPAGMYVENFNAPAAAGGYFAQFVLSPSGPESYPSAGVVQLNGQQLLAMPHPPVHNTSDFYFEAKFFGPTVPVFTIWAGANPSSMWEVNFGSITNPLPTVAHVVMGRQGGVNCAWLNGQKVSPTFADTLAVPSDVISSGTNGYWGQSYTFDAIRFAVGTYYDPTAATIPVPVGDLTW